MLKVLLTLTAIVLASAPASAYVRPASGTVRTLQSSALQQCLRAAKVENDAAVRAANRIADPGQRQAALNRAAATRQAAIKACYRGVNSDTILENIR